MDENTQRQPNPRRRRKTKMEIFKEAYLPTIILGVAAVLILVFIIGSVSRNNAKKKPPVLEEIPSTSESVPSQLELEVQQLLAEAQILALDYNFKGAADLLNGFHGDKSAFPELTAKINEYTQQASQMVAWSDPAQILNLSFHSLIADNKAFSDQQYGKSYNRNFITVAEFRKILADLYENGYVLVDLDDITTCQTDTTGTTCSAKTLYLPLGKKPMLLTQTNLNYYTYMIDGDGDGEPDKDGAGFASRLVVDENGNITCEMVNSSGQTVTGEYDLIPILEAFIAEHPDFSYKGARAILAVSGYDGIFGYRTTNAAKTSKGLDYYNAQVEGATELVAALKDKGYRLACYTYGNTAYGKVAAGEIQMDLNNWNAEVTPILGATDILVFAQNSDIGAYSGSKFNVLHNAGFRYYFGFADNRTGGEIGANYIAQDRLLVTGSQIANAPGLFTGLFDAAAILDPQRGSVPK